MSRPDSELAVEVDYWRLLLEDIVAVNDIIGDASLSLMETQASLLVPALTHPDEAGRREIDDALQHVKNGMDALDRMEDPLKRILALVDGRSEGLRAERDSGISESSN